MNRDKLFSNFPPVSTDDWEATIKTDLRGADYDKKLVWKNQEGFAVRPYYRAEDLINKAILQSTPGSYPYLRGNKSSGNNWEVRFSIEVDDIAEANHKALFFLDRGATSLEFSFKDAPDNTSSGKDLISKLFQGIYLDCIEINFKAGIHTQFLLKSFLEYARENGFDSQNLIGSVLFDPFEKLLVSGKFYIDETADFLLCTEITTYCLKHLPKFRVIGINSSLLGDSGALITQEIAFGLSAASEYIELHSKAGIPVDQIISGIHFTLSSGSDFFAEISRLRAFRFLWAKLAAAWKPANTENTFTYINSVSSNWNQTIFDPYVNLLRNTTSAMSSIIGGADSVQVKAFDSLFRNSNEFSDRIALNTQLILKEEVWLDKVIDPSAGSYYIENLTEAIILRAWAIFLDIEKQGGYLACLKMGIVQEMVTNTAKNRASNISVKKEILLGTNQFPDYNEMATQHIEKELFASLNLSGKEDVKKLEVFRAAAELESIRLLSEKQDHRPKAFMLSLGNPIMRLARANFSSNFFACGGFELIDNAGFDSPLVGLKAALKSKAELIVVCSSDEEYPEIVPLIYQSLQEETKNLSVKPIIVVAGAPACMEDLKSKGIDHFIHVRSNLVQTLKNYQIELGLSH